MHHSSKQRIVGIVVYFRPTKMSGKENIDCTIKIRLLMSVWCKTKFDAMVELSSFRTHKLHVLELAEIEFCALKIIGLDYFLDTHI
jgi:hypothetical protein